MLSTEDVKNLIIQVLPDAEVAVQDMTGTSDHFDIKVVSKAFAGLGRIDQHKMVQAALGEHLTTTIHAVQIKTTTPN